MKVEDAGRYTLAQALAQALSHCRSRSRGPGGLPPELPVPSPELEQKLSAPVTLSEPCAKCKRNDYIIARLKDAACTCEPMLGHTCPICRGTFDADMARYFKEAALQLTK